MLHDDLWTEAEVMLVHTSALGGGAIRPAAELCNGVDDNCDGRRDEGCW